MICEEHPTSDVVCGDCYTKLQAELQKLKNNRTEAINNSYDSGWKDGTKKLQEARDEVKQLEYDVESYKQGEVFFHYARLREWAEKARDCIVSLLNHGVRYGENDSKVYQANPDKAKEIVDTYPAQEKEDAKS